MSEDAPEYSDEDQVIEALPDDRDLPEDEIDDSGYDMADLADHEEADNRTSEELEDYRAEVKDDESW